MAVRHSAGTENKKKIRPWSAVHTKKLMFVNVFLPHIPTFAFWNGPARSVAFPKNGRATSYRTDARVFSLARKVLSPAGT